MESIEETARAHIAKGMRYKEVKDIDDIATVFNIMAITTETLIEELTKQAEDYKAITASFDNNHAAHGEILGALTEEQIKLQQLTSIIEKMSQTTSLTAQKMLTQFQDNLQSKIDQAFNRVDDEAMHQSLQVTIEKSLKSINTEAIDKAAKSMNTGAAKIDKLNQSMGEGLRQISHAVKDFNEIVQTINAKATIVVGSVALLFGLSLGYLLHTSVVDKNFLYWSVDNNHQFFNDADGGHYMRFTQQEMNADNGFYYVKINNIDIK